MALFMTQFAYTPEAWAAMTKQPEDRGKAFGSLCERMGGKMVGLWFAFGDYDGVTIFEAADERTAAAIILAAVGPGHLKTTKTTTLLSPADALEAMRQAGGASYRGPVGSTR